MFEKEIRDLIKKEESKIELNNLKKILLYSCGRGQTLYKLTSIKPLRKILITLLSLFFLGFIYIPIAFQFDFLGVDFLGGLSVVLFLLSFFSVWIFINHIEKLLLKKVVERLEEIEESEREDFRKKHEENQFKEKQKKAMNLYIKAY